MQNSNNPFTDLKLDLPEKKEQKPKDIKKTWQKTEKLKKQKEALQSEDNLEFAEENDLFLTQMAKVKVEDKFKHKYVKKDHNSTSDPNNELFEMSDIFNSVQNFNSAQKLNKKNNKSIKENVNFKQDVLKVKQNKTDSPHESEINDEKKEINEFLKAVVDVKNLHKKGREVIQEVVLPPIISPKITNPMQDFMEGKLEFAIHSTDQYVEGHVLGLDLMTLAKLQSRQYSPEAHIDLHGLNSMQAYNNLISFFRNSYHRGIRTVLIVTGKGKNSFNGTPILRSKVQEWFTKEPFKRVVLAFCSAKIEDGGAGALYVLIRKRKKDHGKIQWDICPTDPDFFL